VTVAVRIAPGLLAEVTPEDTVFVFARAVSGPPMPLAVGRYTLATLPERIVLDDSSAMRPQLRISGFPEVKVQARVAKSGQPVAQPGDLQSRPVQVAVGASDVIDLVIDQRVP
jgi:cytochrome c-type biogenesis protein CcmH